MFLRFIIIYLENSTFPSVKITVYTLIDEWNIKTSLLKSDKILIKHITLLSDAKVPMSVSGHISELSKYS